MKNKTFIFIITVLLYTSNMFCASHQSSKGQKEQVPGYPLPQLENFEKLSEEQKLDALRVFLYLHWAITQTNKIYSQYWIDKAKEEYIKLPKNLQDFFKPYLELKNLTKNVHEKLHVYYNAILATVKDPATKKSMAKWTMHKDVAVNFKNANLENALIHL